MTDAKARTAVRMAALTVLCILAACATTPLPPERRAKPALAQLTQPYITQLRTVGINEVIATGSGRSVRLATNAGAVYFDYPSDVPSSIAFTLRVTAQGVLAYSNNFENSKLDQYRIAVNSILPHAITRTFWNNEWVEIDSIDRF
jgi:hypothetical protein